MDEQPRVEGVLALIDKTIKFVNNIEVYPRINASLDIAVLALLSKSLIVGKSVCALVKEGFYEEAFGLTRTIVDLYFTVRYITNRDFEDRARKFAYFFAKDHEGWLRIVNKHYPAARIPEHPQREEMLEEAKNYKNPHKWTGLPDQIRHMAMEDDADESDQKGNPLRCEFDYEVIYKWTSHYVHPTVVALDTHASDRPGPFVVHARSQDGQRFKDMAMFNVVIYVNHVLICALRCLGIKFPDHLSNEFDALRKSF